MASSNVICDQNICHHWSTLSPEISPNGAYQISLYIQGDHESLVMEQNSITPKFDEEFQ